MAPGSARRMRGRLAAAALLALPLAAAGMVAVASRAQEPAPSLQVLFYGVDGEPSTKPGGRFNVGGDGFSCTPVFVFFDGEPVAEVPVVQRDIGLFTGAVFDAPPTAGPGEHTITASCDPSGTPVAASLPFRFTGAATPTPAPATPARPREGHERSVFAASLHGPDEVSTDPGLVARNAGLAALLVLLAMFPAELFNKTLEEHYDEVRGWFGPLGRGLAAAGRWLSALPRALAFGLFALVSAVLYGFLDPRFGFDRASVALVLGLVGALAVFTVSYELVIGGAVRRRHGVEGHLRMFPGALVVAGACVVVSRAVGFSPGYVYALLAGMAFREVVAEGDEGRGVALAGLMTLGVGLAAWFAWMPVRDAATEADPAFVTLVLDTLLAAVWVAALEGLVFGLVPLRLLDGEKLLAWLALFSAGAFGFVHVLLHPEEQYLPTADRTSLATAVALFVGFGMVSVAFWGWFRLRSPDGDEDEDEEGREVDAL